MGNRLATDRKKEVRSGALRRDSLHITGELGDLHPTGSQRMNGETRPCHSKPLKCAKFSKPRVATWREGDQGEPAFGRAFADI